MKLNLTVTTANDDVYPIEVEDSEPVSKLRETVQMLSSIPPSLQHIMVNGKPLTNAPSLAAAGVSDGDLLFVTRGGPPVSNALAQNPDGSAVDPHGFMAAIRGNPGFMGQIRQSNRALEEAILASNAPALQELLREVQRMQDQRASAAELPADPLDPEYQRKMYEAIQQKNIDENYSSALEHSPEVFGSVEMLYVDMAANGEPLKAFIDSGAQMTIMTQTCAEKCNLMRLVDQRFHGMAVGVGSNRIIGRIHACPLKVGDHHISTSISVLEQKDGPQFIFGLENLKRHQCCINLLTGMLDIGSTGCSLPFLAEHEVPKDFNRERQRPDDAKDELDAGGNVPSAAEGDTSVIQPSAAGQAGPEAATAAAPSTSGRTPAGASNGQALAQQLQEITGATLEQCQEALRVANGNIDLAAGHLLGL